MNFGNSSSSANPHAVALRKLQEDPLFLIKKEEAKHHKNLMENPLVRERVKQLLKAEKERDVNHVKEEARLPRSEHVDPSERVPTYERARERSDRGVERRLKSRSRSPEYSSRRRDDRYRRRSRSRSNEGRRRSPSRDRYRRSEPDRHYDRRRYN